MSSAKPDGRRFLARCTHGACREWGSQIRGAGERDFGALTTVASEDGSEVHEHGVSASPWIWLSERLAVYSWDPIGTVQDGRGITYGHVDHGIFPPPRFFGKLTGAPVSTAEHLRQQVSHRNA